MSSSQKITLSQTKIQDVTPLIFYICRVLPHPRTVSYYSRPFVRDLNRFRGKAEGRQHCTPLGRWGYSFTGSYKGQKHPSGGATQRVHIYIFGLRTLFGVYLNLWSTFGVYIHPNYYKPLSAQKNCAQPISSDPNLRNCAPAFLHFA